MPNFAYCSFSPLWWSCWGVPSPNPADRLPPQIFFSLPFGSSAICGVVGSKRKFEKYFCDLPWIIALHDGLGRRRLSSRIRFSQKSSTENFQKYFSHLPCKTVFHDGLGEAVQPNFYAFLKKSIKENLLFFGNGKKQGAKTAEKRRYIEGFIFEWVQKSQKNGVKWKKIYLTGCKNGVFAAVSRGTFLYLAKAEQPNFYAVTQKSIKENLLFSINHEKWVVKTPEKLC